MAQLEFTYADMELYFRGSEAVDKKRRQIETFVGVLRSILQRDLDPRLDLPKNAHFLFGDNKYEFEVSITKYPKSRSPDNMEVLASFRVARPVLRRNDPDVTLHSFGIGSSESLSAELVVALHPVLSKVVNYFAPYVPSLAQEIERMQKFAS